MRIDRGARGQVPNRPFGKWRRGNVPNDGGSFVNGIEVIVIWNNLYRSVRRFEDKSPDPPDGVPLGRNSRGGQSAENKRSGNKLDVFVKDGLIQWQDRSGDRHAFRQINLVDSRFYGIGWPLATP
jgi:hypothetical protein